MLKELPQTTGRDLDAWIVLVKASGAHSRAERVAWLMGQHGFGRVAATAVASRVDGDATDYEDQSGLLDAMYAGPKAPLRAIYERLVELGNALGPEFSLYQCGSQTTFKRGRQFAWIKPTTRTRVDLGLALPGCEPCERLVPVSGTNDKDRVRLRIGLSSVTDVDAEVEQWLARAWELEAQIKK